MFSPLTVMPQPAIDKSNPFEVLKPKDSHSNMTHNANGAEEDKTNTSNSNSSTPMKNVAASSTNAGAQMEPS